MLLTLTERLIKGVMGEGENCIMWIASRSMFSSRDIYYILAAVIPSRRVRRRITVIPRLTKIIRSGITFVSRNVISRRFL